MRKHFKFIEDLVYETGDIFYFKLEKYCFYHLFRLFFLQLRGKAQEMDLSSFLKNGLVGSEENVDTLKQCLSNFPCDLYMTEINKSKGEYKIHLFFSTNKGFCYCTVNALLYEVI